MPVQFSQVPCYVPITLSPGSTISGTFQQNITFNPSTYSAYESGDLGNIRFYSSMSGNVLSGPLDSWLEGCPETACTPSSSHAIFWVKLPNGETQTAPGNTIYMVFGNTIGAGSQFDGVVAGEAPQLSCLTPGPGCTPVRYIRQRRQRVPDFLPELRGRESSPRMELLQLQQLRLLRPERHRAYEQLRLRPGYHAVLLDAV